jgi:hypothetical protein
MKEYFKTDAKFLKLDIKFPYEAMLAEARALKHKFTDHRGNAHKGWKSLALYGLGDDLHENWSDYGYSSASEAAEYFKWTDSAHDCPVTLNFFLNHFPCQRYGRVRFMLVEAGGFIGMHNDSRIPLVENINMALNNPKQCIWTWGDGEELFMEPGGAYAMNIHYDHAIYNNSNEDRFHLIAARHDSTTEWKRLINKAVAETGTNGQYITLDDLP